MSEQLQWSNTSNNYSTGLTFAAMFFVVFGLMLDDLVWGVVIGAAWFVAFALVPKKRSVRFDGQTLRLVEGKRTTELPAASVADVKISGTGAMVVQTVEGETISVKPEDDDPELRAFAERLRSALPV